MSVVENVQEKRSLGSRISRIVWDRDEKPEHERKFVQWLDLHLFVIACLGYFIKYVRRCFIYVVDADIWVILDISTRLTSPMRMCPV